MLKKAIHLHGSSIATQLPKSVREQRRDKGKDTQRARAQPNLAIENDERCLGSRRFISSLEEWKRPVCWRGHWPQYEGRPGESGDILWWPSWNVFGTYDSLPAFTSLSADI